MSLQITEGRKKYLWTIRYNSNLLHTEKCHTEKTRQKEGSINTSGFLSACSNLRTYTFKRVCNLCTVL